jgi:hypothetical protein
MCARFTTVLSFYLICRLSGTIGSSPVCVTAKIRQAENAHQKLVLRSSNNNNFLVHLLLAKLDKFLRTSKEAWFLILL